MCLVLVQNSMNVRVFQSRSFIKALKDIMPHLFLFLCVTYMYCVYHLILLKFIIQMNTGNVHGNATPCPFLSIEKTLALVMVCACVRYDF